MSILSVLVGIGMTPLLPKLERAGPPEVLHVLLDGCVVGSISSVKIEEAVAHIRWLKLSGICGVCLLGFVTYMLVWIILYFDHGDCRFLKIWRLDTYL